MLAKDILAGKLALGGVEGQEGRFVYSRNDEYIQQLSERQGRFRKYIGDELFETVKEFFQFLFEGDDPPLENRRYIIITRKGFSIFLAGVLYGMVDGSVYNPDVVMSDRQWKKLTPAERNIFVEGHDVFIVDDSIITASTIQRTYFAVEKANSRRVVVLTEEHRCDYSKMFQHYKAFKGTTVNERERINETVLYALYKLAVPFSAESPIYHIRLNQNGIENIRKSAEQTGWVYKETPLDFGSAGIAHNAACFYPLKLDGKFGANVLSYGVRMCFTPFEDVEKDKELDVFLIPWVFIDVMDFSKAKDFLLETIRKCFGESYKKKWLYKQLSDGELWRKRSVVCRVVSYLYDTCIASEFRVAVFGNKELPLFKLPNGIECERYHFSAELLEEMRHLQGAITTDVIAKAFRMDKELHDDLASDLYEMVYGQLFIPPPNQTIQDLGKTLCFQRENTIDEKTLTSDFPSDRRTHPLLCYSYDRGGALVLLDYIRRAVASLTSFLISYSDGGIYLLNTLAPGEGSPLIFLENYDFLLALHRISMHDNYTSGMLEKAADAWNNLKGDKLSKVSKTMVKMLEATTSLYWASYDRVEKALKNQGREIEKDVADFVADFVDSHFGKLEVGKETYFMELGCNVFIDKNT